MPAKILVIDTETSPEVVYTFSRFDTTIGQTQVIEGIHLLCIAWMFAGDKEVNSLGLFDQRAWKRGDKRNDKALVLKAWELLDEADIVCGHNVKSFDIGILNARFVAHGLPPPSPYKVIDTLSILKRHFHLQSRSLEAASHYFGMPIKEKQGFGLWRACLDGDPKAWKKMLAYCARDVLVVDKLREKLTPYITGLNMGLYTEDGGKYTCPKCGGTHLQKRGKDSNLVNRFVRLRCCDCGGWSRLRIPDQPKRKHLLQHAGV